MRFGHFDDQNKEYVITGADPGCPINYLAVRIFSVQLLNIVPAATAFTDARCAG